MRLVLAGASGFLGGLLRQRLQPAHDLVVLTRHARGLDGVKEVEWQPDGTAGAWADAIDGADAVINVAGRPLVSRRWSAREKALLVASRVDPARSLVAAIERAAARPRVLVSASAVGYYGAHGDEIVTEETPAGSDFLASLCEAWEEAAFAADALGTRVVTMRSGLVLARGGGALAPMFPLFRLGLGGPIGSGRQYWPWIHGDDWAGLVEALISQPTVSGAVNLTAPQQVTNREFARALGRALRRPAILPAPAFAVRLVLGEVADALLLQGQRVVPGRALALGYRFAYEDIDAAFAEIVGNPL